jgi:hypothetical protein
MTHESEVHQAQQRIRVYRTVTQLLDAVFDLPKWFNIEQWDRETVSLAFLRCQWAVNAVTSSVLALESADDLTEASRITCDYANEWSDWSQREVEFVRAELYDLAN